MTYALPEPNHDECTHVLASKGVAYPRTCRVCGLGPCKSLAGQAIQSKAIPDPVTLKDTPTVFDVVQKAEHYNTHPSGIEAIHIVRCLNFNMGCAVKYVMRRHGKEYARSLKSAAYYLADQHKSGNQMVVNGLAYRLLDEYAQKEPVAQARAFYRNVSAYLMHPSDNHYRMASEALTRLQGDGV